jgi:translation elongation factor EF-Ts
MGPLIMSQTQNLPADKIKKIVDLKKATGRSVKDCHEVLKQCNWDIEAAKQKLKPSDTVTNFSWGI